MNFTKENSHIFKKKDKIQYRMRIIYVWVCVIQLFYKSTSIIQISECRVRKRLKQKQSDKIVHMFGFVSDHLDDIIRQNTNKKDYNLKKKTVTIFLKL